MLVRLFVGERWSEAAHEGDWRFDILPAVGHKLAIAFRDGWGVGEVKDIVHRLTRADDAADIALLVARLDDGGGLDAALPLAALDRLGEARGSGGPWGR